MRAGEGEDMRGVVGSGRGAGETVGRLGGDCYEG